jgi:hypothetical protein
MAKINDNLLVKGARGHVGKQLVYKKRGNDTLLARMPSVNKDAEVTQDQEKARDLFAEAVRYASGAITDPVLKNQYQEKTGPSNTAYNIAFRDYLKAPIVKSINAENYDGTVGSSIIVSAVDDFRVAEVKVRISAPDGTIVEEGNALLHPIDRNKWTYVATALVAAIAGVTITAVAKDIPGNKGTLEVTL